MPFALPTPPRTPRRNGAKTPGTPSRRRSATKFKFGLQVPGYAGALRYETSDSAMEGVVSSVGPGTTVKSGGFISSTKSALAARSKEAKYNRLGTSITYEVGGNLDAGVSTATAGNTVAIGHANVAANVAHTMMWRAIVKRLFVAQGHNDLSNFEAALSGAATGDLVRVRYRLSADAAWTNRDYTMTAGTTSPNLVSISLAQFFYTIETDIEFQFIEYRPDSAGPTQLAYIQLPLKNCQVHFTGKSTLKIQNRTINTTGGDEESVDNVPLYGRVYGGNGNGTEAKTQDNTFIVAAMSFRGDETHGAIAKVPTERWYQEIPEPSMFTNVLTVGKISLDPGQVKTSALSFDKSYALNKIYKSNFNTAVTHPKCNFGKYRFMLLEKMINSSTPSATNSIKIAYEINNRFACYITTYKDTTTAMMNNLSNFASEI